MTLEEAHRLRKEFLKLDIRNRLHRYNPSRFPKPKMYTASQALEVEMTIQFSPDRIKNLFERDDIFYKYFKNK